jgi:hypothetical protein
MRLVRANQRYEAHPKCIREGKPCSQDAELSSTPSYGEGVRTHVSIVNLHTPLNVAGGAWAQQRGLFDPALTVVLELLARPYKGIRVEMTPVYSARPTGRMKRQITLNTGTLLSHPEQHKWVG